MRNVAGDQQTENSYPPAGAQRSAYGYLWSVRVRGATIKRISAVILIFALTAAIAVAYMPSSQQSVMAGKCVSADAAAVQQVIIRQTDALSMGEFTRAHSYASQSFRSGVSDSQFERVITNGYAFLTENPQITFNSCEQIDQQKVQTFASFEVEDVVASLQFVIVFEFGEWFIDSATTAQDVTISV